MHVGASLPALALLAAAFCVAASPATYFKLIATAASGGRPGSPAASRSARPRRWPWPVGASCSPRWFSARWWSIHEGWPRWSSKEWLTLSALGASGIFLYNLCFLYGLTMIEAGRGALVVALTPAVVAASDWLLFGAPMSPGKAPASAWRCSAACWWSPTAIRACCFAGEVGLGEWLIIGCSVLWAVYTFLGRRGTRSLSPLAMTFRRQPHRLADADHRGAAAGFAVFAGRNTWRGWSAIVFLGLFGTALAFTWYAEAVQRIGATRSAAFINLVPVSAVILGALLLDERLGVAVLSGGALVIAGVSLPITPARASRPAPSARRKLA
jgi:drug/metabolite transporter (DMT)-like permease